MATPPTPAVPTREGPIIRRSRPGDGPALRRVFESSVRGIAYAFYTPAQIAAWAPADHDPQAWAQRIDALRPFVAEVDGDVAGYADLQPSGEIDHFFVAAPFAGRGVGSALMAALHASAAAQALAGMSAHVSLAAEAFFAGHGFRVVRRQSVDVRGVTLCNALMHKALVRAAR